MYTHFFFYPQNIVYNSIEEASFAKRISEIDYFLFAFIFILKIKRIDRL